MYNDEDRVLVILGMLMAEGKDMTLAKLMLRTGWRREDAMGVLDGMVREGRLRLDTRQSGVRAAMCFVRPECAGVAGAGAAS